MSEAVKNILITGATGRVGVNLVVELIENTNDILWLLIRKKESEIDIKKRFVASLNKQNKFFNPDDYADRIKIICGDLNKPQVGISDYNFNRMLNVQISEIFHLAAFGDRKCSSIEKIFEVNVEGTLRVLNLAKGLGVKVINYTGMIYSYSGKNQRYIEEKVYEAELEFNNITEYSRQISETVIANFCSCNSISWRNIRLSMIIDIINYNEIQNTWYFFFFKTIFDITRSYKEAFGDDYFNNNPLYFLSDDVEVYLSTPSFVAEVIRCLYTEGNASMNRTYNVYSTSFNFYEIAKMIGRVLGVNEVLLQSNFNKLPRLEKIHYKRSNAFMENLLSQRRFSTINLQELLSKHRIRSGDITVESIEKLALFILSNHGFPSKKRFYKKLIKRLAYGR